MGPNLHRVANPVLSNNLHKIQTVIRHTGTRMSNQTTQPLTALHVEVLTKISNNNPPTIITAIPPMVAKGANQTTAILTAPDEVEDTVVPTANATDTS